MELSSLTFKRSSSEVWGEGSAVNAVISAANPTSVAPAAALLFLLEQPNKETWSLVLEASRILPKLQEKKLSLRSALEEGNE